MNTLKYRAKYGTLLLSPMFAALVACGGGGSSSSSSGGSTPPPPTPVNSAGSVSVSGDVTVGQTLSASVSDANGTAGSNIVYQWRGAGTNISGATSATYVPVASDVGNALSVNVQYTDNDGFSENVTSAETGAVADAVPPNSSGSITISGTAQAGQTLMATIADSNGISTSTPSYQWQSASTDIAGATEASYTVSNDDVGNTISVNVTYTDDDGYDESITSESTSIVIAAGGGGNTAGNFARGSLGAKDSVPEINCDTIYTTTSSFEDNATRTMTPGTTICLADGTYTGLELDFGGAGTETAPITVAAQNPGGAIIGGDVSVRMSGSFAVLQGLVFQGGTLASSDFLQTRNGSGANHCNSCRITEIALIDLQSDNSGNWLNIYGPNNRVDHSWFAGKTNAGPILIINREIPSGSTAADVVENFTEIDHNYFGDRPPVGGKAYAENSDNGYEAIRLGTSPAHAFDSFSSVNFNYFERIDGEAEVISNKAGSNTISNNTIRDSYGSLTTRHGSSATIEGNVIIGDGHPFAGGLRIVDDGHRIVNNYIEGTRYLNTRFHGGIVIHNGNSSTTNGYQDVTNILVANNTIVDSVNSLNVNGGNQNVDPQDIIVVNNIIDDAIGPIITYADEGLPAASTYAGNYVEGSPFSDNDAITSSDGFTVIDPALIEDGLGISRPDPANSAAIAAAMAIDYESFDAVSDDMDGDARPSTTVSGADHISAAAAIKGLLTPLDIGPMNYAPEFSVGYVDRIDLANSGFDNAASGWSFTAPASITTTVGEFFARQASAKIDGSGRIEQDVTVMPNTNYTLSAFTKGPIVLGVDIGGTETTSDANNSKYRFTSTSFNSGAASAVTIFSELDGTVSRSADIGGSAFTDFTANSSDPNWTITEGGTLGQVQFSSNSASGADGSLKFKLNTNAELGNMGVTQLIENIVPNTAYTLSAFALEKNDQAVTATIGVYEAGTTTVVASKVLDYAALEASGAESGDDSFLRDSFTFNSGSNTSLTLFVTYNPNNVFASGGTAGQTEFRVDDISLTYDGAPSADTSAFVDDFRLVSHGNE